MSRKHRIDFAEMFWWFLFAGGGMVLAILIPVNIFVLGVLGPLGVVPGLTGRYAAFSAVLGNPFGKIYFFVLIAAPLFHWAHRFRIVIGHMGVDLGRQLHPWLIYGLAVVGALIAAYVIAVAP